MRAVRPPLHKQHTGVHAQTRYTTPPFHTKNTISRVRFVYMCGCVWMGYFVSVLFVLSLPSINHSPALAPPLSLLTLNPQMSILSYPPPLPQTPTPLPYQHHHHRVIITATTITTTAQQEEALALAEHKWDMMVLIY